ncbi:MAG TPA: F0F1 ATP synthase subunit B [Spirochaetia bacterium]
MALLRVDPGLVIWLWITFGVLLLVLRFTAWDKITGALDKRSNKIASDLEAARIAGEKAGGVIAEYEQKIREGREEAARIIEAARAEAARLREEIVRKSQDEARELKERAEHDIEIARQDAERALRGQVVDLSFSIADAILKRETGSADNRAYVEEFADKLMAGSSRN